MTPPLLLLLAGLVALGSAALVLRSYGPRYRVGRLLAATPSVSIAEAVELAQSGRQAYVRVRGRIDSDEDFEDADHRPLVLRRTTLASRRDGESRAPWVTFDATVETVPFVVREGLDELAVDGRELGDGLVVVPKESVGTIADLGDRAPAGLPAAAPARLRIEQVSSVEHAVVLGVPVREDDGRVRMAPGLGRPLILTTMDDSEAMRVLVGGDVTRPRLAAALIALGAALVAVGLAWLIAGAVLAPQVVAAASPDPTMRVGSDTRGPGSGPGLVGDPAFAVLAVVGIGVAALAASLGYVRLTSRRAGPGSGR